MAAEDLPKISLVIHVIEKVADAWSAVAIRLTRQSFLFEASDSFFVLPLETFVHFPCSL